VLVRGALVSEVLRELVDLLETADDQALEIELVRDAQVQVGIELVRVRDERLGEAPSVPGLEDRRFDLQKAFAVQIGADSRDDRGARGREAA
jgi:hypothetical protein